MLPMQPIQPISTVQPSHLANGAFGIDVSSQSLQAALLANVVASPTWEKEVPLTTEGIAHLLEATSAEIPWVVEPTGRYSIQVVKQARDAGRTVLLAPAREA